MPSANVPAFGPITVPAFGPLTSPKVRTIGIMAALFVVQLFVWLSTVVDVSSNGDSPVFGGNWSTYATGELFYLVGMLFAMGLVAYTPDLSLTPKLRDVSQFLINYSLWTFITWGALSLIFPAGSGALAPVGISRYESFIFTGLFVAPTEELLFRVILPRVLNSWVLGSCVAFSLFHVPVELLNYGSQGLIAVSEALIEIAILGIILYFIYSFTFKIRTKKGIVSIRSGYGGAVGFHAAYDNFVASVLTKFPIGLVPV